jgi:hypothetical protein
MFKLIFFCFIFLNILPVVSFSQSASKIDYDLVFNKAKYGQKNISLDHKYDKKPSFPFLEKIEVVDVRSDTTCIGFRNRNTEKNNQILQFTNGLKAEFESFLAKTSIFAGDPKAYGAVLVVRDYWINEFEVDENDKDKFTENRGGWYNARKTALRATFDIYLVKDDACYVAYRFDTLATAFLNIKEFSEAYLETILCNSLLRLQTLNPQTHIVNKRKFTRNELHAYYAGRWNKPIITDVVPESGVYRNFTEFLNNKPSVTNFVVRKDKLVDVLYVPTGNAEMTPARDVWGYCDGKNIFIKSGENYYPLVKVQNGFYFLGSKELMKSQDDYYMYDPYMGTNMRVNSEAYLRNRLFPMKVDMDKGVAY